MQAWSNISVFGASNLFYTQFPLARYVGENGGVCFAREAGSVEQSTGRGMDGLGAPFIPPLLSKPTQT